MEILASLAESLVRGQADEVSHLTKEGIQKNLQPLEILNGGLIAGMEVVGQKFRDGELYVPDVLVSARAMRAGMDILKPLFAQANIQPVGRVILGTVRGDLHDIGKNLVGIMMEGAGFEVIDLGTDVAPEKFVAAVREHRPKVLGMSALLTVTMVGMKAVLDERSHVGGWPALGGRLSGTVRAHLGRTRRRSRRFRRHSPLRITHNAGRVHL